MTPIDEHLANLPAPQRATLEMLRDTLRELLPTAEEKLSYRMPCFAVKGKAVAGFDGFKEHCSYFPHSGSVIAEAGPLPTWAVADAGTLRFPIGKHLPKSLVARLVRVRLDQISDVRNGKCFEFFDDGRVKSEGSMKDGLRNGEWRWFDRDGAVVRSARFRLGGELGV